MRIIQEKCFQRVGGNKEINVNVRLICATNQHLEQLVDKGKFRPDLFYRIAVFPVHIPSIEKRKADIIPLANHFLKMHARINTNGVNANGQEMITSAAAKWLREYHWPGNIRELANTIERVMILKDGKLPVTSDNLFFMQAQPQARESIDDIFSLPAGGIDYDGLQKVLSTEHEFMCGEKVERKPAKSVKNVVGDLYNELMNLTNKKVKKDEVFDVLSGVKTKAEVIQKYTK